MKKRINILIVSIISVLFIFMAACSPKKITAQGNPDIGGAYEEMYAPDFWIGKNFDKEIMTKEQVQAYDYSIKHTETFKVFDLDEHPQQLTGDELKARINAYIIPVEKRYTGSDGKTPVTKEYYNRLTANRNMGGIDKVNEVEYGIITAETALRDFPGAEPSYDEEGNLEFDLFFENRMKVWERCLILHTSADGKWYFIQCMSFRGWINAEHAAKCDRQTWQKYKNMDFVVVTGNRVLLDEELYDADISRKEMLMGTRIPLLKGIEEVNNVSTASSYTVLLPVRGDDGNLIEKTGRIPKNADVTEGYLPMTRENMIRQSFKMLGERYGWGGSHYARDCSAFIRDIYFCFGVEIPKNSAGQGAMPANKKFNVAGMDVLQKEKLIKSQHPGAVLEMQGHVMLYLGEFNGKAYVIHDVYAFGESGKDGSEGRKNINCVTVSDLYVTRKDGSTFLENIRNINAMA